MVELNSMIDVIPGIFEKDLSAIKERISLASPDVSWLHIDVADQTLVANESFRDFSQWKDMPKHISFEAHLMVVNPEMYVKQLADAGFKRLIAHVECQDPRRFLEMAQYEEVEVGLAIDGPTEFEIFEPFLEELDVALIMTIEAGFSGQPFLPETIEKIKMIHQNVPDITIEVDGGINATTAKLCVESGASRLVSTSYLFSNKGLFREHLTELQAL
jgi:ribulose-phosphate 3-epimerase